MLSKDLCEVMVPSKEERQFLIQLDCVIIIHNIIHYKTLLSVLRTTYKDLIMLYGG